MPGNLMTYKKSIDNFYIIKPKTWKNGCFT